MAAGTKGPQYQESDVPGFLNPIVDGKPDTSQYVTAADAEQAIQSGIEAPAIPRSQALALMAKSDGIQHPTDKEGEAALAKRKKKPEEPKPAPTALDYPI